MQEHDDQSVGKNQKQLDPQVQQYVWDLLQQGGIVGLNTGIVNKEIFEIWLKAVKDQAVSQSLAGFHVDFDAIKKSIQERDSEIHRLNCRVRELECELAIAKASAGLEKYESRLEVERSRIKMEKQLTETISDLSRKYSDLKSVDARLVDKSIDIGGNVVGKILENILMRRK